MGWLRVYGRLGRFTWRMLAAVLVGQSVLLFFGALVARGMQLAEGGRGSTELWAGTGLALIALVAAGLLRTPVGVSLGWLVQVLTWLAAVKVPMMLAVGLIFTGLWVASLRQGHTIDRAHPAEPAGTGQ